LHKSKPALDPASAMILAYAQADQDKDALSKDRSIRSTPRLRRLRMMLLNSAPPLTQTIGGQDEDIRAAIPPR
jgi:hypothetical protein